MGGDMDPDLPALTLLALIAVHAFFAAAEVAVISAGQARLQPMSGEVEGTARLIRRLATDPPRLLTATQLATKLFGFLTVVLAVGAYGGPLAGVLASLNPAWSPATHQTGAVVLITVALVLVVAVAGELVPRALATRYPEPIARLAAYPLAALVVMTAPLARLAAEVNRWLTGNRGRVGGLGLPLVTEEQIKTLVDAGEEGGVIEEEEKEMIYSIFQLGETLVREVMVPRIDVAALEIKTSLKEALAVIVQAGHSRIPVFEDTIDNIVGILYAKDLLQYWPDFEALNLRDILRDAYYVPETKPVDELLAELQKRKVHIAIVVDEYGGVAGLATIEDILEEIVGEIQDEYDTEEAVVEVIGPDEIIYDGRVDLDDVNHTMNIELPRETSDTVGGLIHNSLGRVAAVGDRVQFGNVQLTVVSMHGRRIKKVKVTRPASDAAAEVAGDLSRSGTPIEGGAACAQDSSLAQPPPYEDRGLPPADNRQTQEQDTAQ